VELYTRPTGASPIAKFIEKQSIRDQAIILAEFDDLEEFGLQPRGSKFKHLEGKLWELRFRGVNKEFRFIYFTFTGKKFVILHGFIKKSPKTPKRELATARRCFKDHLAQHG